MAELEKWKAWEDSTNLLILEVELHDLEFRKMNSGHKCNRGWHETAPGRWFCQHLLSSRNKKMKEKIDWNLGRSPTLDDSELLSEMADTIN